MNETISWIGAADGHLSLIDQTKLPNQLTRIECRDVETVWEAIKMLRVRGAPALGVSAGFATVLGIRNWEGADVQAFMVDESSPEVAPLMENRAQFNVAVGLAARGVATL